MRIQQAAPRGAACAYKVDCLEICLSAAQPIPSSLYPVLLLMWEIVTDLHEAHLQSYTAAACSPDAAARIKQSA